MYLGDFPPDVRTRTPSDVIAAAEPLAALPALHSGSWIDADFHIWIGQAEKNRAWDLLARTRRALVEAGSTPERDPGAWDALFAAEGSDWFWWFGDDHWTADRAIFDRLFREHLEAVYDRMRRPADRATRPGRGPWPVLDRAQRSRDVARGARPHDRRRPKLRPVSRPLSDRRGVAR